MEKVGTRAQVWHGTAERTSGGLRKKDLMMKRGRIRSRKASRSAKRSGNLRKAGWTFKKGEFGAVRVGEEKKKPGSRKKRRTGKRNQKRQGGNGIQIGDLGIFLTKDAYEDRIRERYSLEPSVKPVNSPGGITDENPSGMVWEVGKGLPDVPYLWTEEADKKLISYK